MALPCDWEGQCMVCKEKPSPSETLSCGTCATPWHLSCLPQPPLSLSDTHWDCPDCTQTPVAPSSVAPPPFSDHLLSAIRHIQSDSSLTDQQKANKRQQLLSGGVSADQPSPSNPTDLLLDGTFNCSICVHLPDRPVTTPCGHNFCLKCFQKMVAQGNRSCANCRSPIPRKMASQPRINSQLAMAIRLAKTAQSDGPSGQPKVQHFVRNQDRPATAFTTERAKKTGKANACSGKIFVTVAQDHFGPILAENDPDRNRGVLVGDTWEDRMECRQWGAHLPHVSGIAGQSHYGAQSVALSGGYVDDEDHGEWFLYTGSGGRDLSGNKRTNKNQSFDQKFELHNEALRVSCRKGYPVRVVRSHKEKRSSYAPESGLRYDGIYRVEKCWRKIGVQGWKVCRYLFVRCDNEPAPWTSDESGDRPRPLPQVDELKDAVDLTERKCDPWWDYDGEKACWLWKRPPPETQIKAELKDGTTVRGKRKAKDVSVKQRLLKEFGCQICRKVLSFPLTTPCGHNFCKACLEGAFSGQSFVRNRECKGGRTLRAQKTVMKCPSCSNDIADFLQNPQVNREMMSIIESLQSEAYEQSDDSHGAVDDSKPTDSSEEVLEEINDGEESSDENLHDATEVSKIVDSSEKVLEEIKDNDLNQPHKRKKD